MFCCGKQSLSSTIAFKSILKITKRNNAFKYEKKKPITPCDIALSYYDVFYKSIFKEKWKSIRLGLLSREKTVAIVNNFGDVQSTKNMLEEQGAVLLKSFFDVQEKQLKNLIEDCTNIKGEKNELENTILGKLREAEDTEANEICPPDRNFNIKEIVNNEDLFKYSQGESIKNNENFYDPEEALTSMEYDISKAQIDNTRLILPDSDENSLHEFVPASTLRSNTDYISESEYYKFYRAKTQFNIHIEQEKVLQFPESIKAYVFPRGDFTHFPESCRGVNNVLDYHLMNGADLLAVLAMDVQPGEIVLDMFPNKGNLTFCLLQSLRPKLLVCNSNEEIQALFSKYIYDYMPNWKDMLVLTNFDFNKDSMEENDLFDKIVLDINCTDDRRSLTEADYNYFAIRNKKVRLNLPEKQCYFLGRALSMVRPGGTVLYTSTTMCPIQNDGVVAETLHSVWKEKNIEACVKKDWDMDFCPDEDGEIEYNEEYSEEEESDLDPCASEDDLDK